MTNEELGDLGPEAWVLFVCLTMLADREGRLEDRPRRIKAQACPFWDWDIDNLLSDLWKKCLILRFEKSGQKIIQITNWKKYQRPHPRESPSMLPGPNDPDINGTPDSIGRKNRRTQGPPRNDLGQSLDSPFPSVPSVPSGSSGIYSNPVKAVGRGSGGNQSLGNRGTPNGVTSPPYRESEPETPKKPEPRKRRRPTKRPKPEAPKKPPIQHEPPPDIEFGRADAPRKPAGSEMGGELGVGESSRMARPGPELTQDEFSGPSAASRTSGAFLWPYTRNQVDGVRVVLESYGPPGLPRPDDGVCRAVLDIAKGSGVDDIEAVVRSLWLRGKFRSAYSWGFFPQVLRGRFRRAS